MTKKFREFPPTQVQHGNKLVRGAVLACFYCPANIKIPMNSVQGINRDVNERQSKLTRRKLEAAGWLVGERERDDMCPDCAKKHKEMKQRARVNGHTGDDVMPSTAVQAVQVIGPPKSMSREDRRVIFAKLQEVYVNEITGYGPGWTDAKVAQDMNCPRAWVTTIRDENFGPLNSNSDMVEQIAEAKLIVAQAFKVLDEVSAVKSALETMQIKITNYLEVVNRVQRETAPLANIASKMQTQLKDIEKALR